MRVLPGSEERRIKCFRNDRNDYFSNILFKDKNN